MTKVTIGLGSNLGNREEYLRQAISKLSSILENISLSRIYESPAMLPENAPPSWNIPFLNMAIAGDTKLDVHALLTEVKRIEILIGRHTKERWSPREIDLDILTYGMDVIHDDTIDIPHRGMLERAFVIRPLNDVLPDFIYPDGGIFYGKSIREISALANLAEHNNCTLYHSTIPHA
jgi:2-amino-4-hydroxy-6-hydroxymethyldihydropteridine diphosphokinase